MKSALASVASQPDARWQDLGALVLYRGVELKGCAKASFETEEEALKGRMPLRAGDFANLSILVFVEDDVLVEALPTSRRDHVVQFSARGRDGHCGVDFCTEPMRAHHCQRRLEILETSCNGISSSFHHPTSTTIQSR